MLRVRHTALAADNTGRRKAILRLVFFANVWVLFTPLLHAQVAIPASGIINTVAGQSAQSYEGDGGPAISAQLNAPNGVALDSAGNVYIADSSNNRIRKITISTGVITTVAGNGIAGYSGDGGAATNAELNNPSSVLVDSAGNLYIADSSNSRIRKIAVSTGIISTFAGNGTQGYAGDGGAATSAEFSDPSSLAIDSASNLYIADHYNSRVRKVAASSGIVTTVAGNGTSGYSGDGGPAVSAEINLSEAVAVDASGNLYIADYYNYRVRKVAYSTGTISTVAGNGTAGYTGDGGPATSAEMSPFGVSVDSSGNLYITDYNGAIRKYQASTGTITTVAGNGTWGYTGDGGLATSAELTAPTMSALDPAGNLYIADMGNRRVREVKISTGFITTLAGTGVIGFGGDGATATNAEIASPQGVAVDSAFDFFITDTGNNRIRKVIASTGIISTIAGNGTAGYAGDGASATSAELASPAGVAVDAAGNIYIADKANNRIRKIAKSTGIISTLAGNGTYGYAGDGGAATAAELYEPQGVAADSLGNIYVADNANERIRKITLSSGIITTIAGNGTLGYSGDGGAGTAAELSNPTGIAVDKNGNVYVADSSNNRIRKITVSTGVISTVAGSGVAGYSGNGGAATNAQLHNPNAVAVDALGDIYIADFSNSVIRKVTASTGLITTIAGNGTNGDTGDGGAATSAELEMAVTGLGVDPAGNIYVSHSGQQASPPPPPGCKLPRVCTTYYLPLGGRVRAVGTSPATQSVASISPTAAGEGAAVTISGTGFGAAQGTSYVTISGISTAITAWSNTSIAVKVPSGAGSGPGTVLVFMNGIASNPETLGIPTQLTVSLSQSTISYGQTAGVSAVITSNTPSTPQGTIGCASGSVLSSPQSQAIPSGGSGSATLSFTFTGLPQGNDTITCTFTRASGTSWKNATATAIEDVIPSSLPVTVSLGSSGASTTYGDLVTLSSTVTSQQSSSFTPTGTVSFYVDTSLYATQPIVNGSAQTIIGTLSLGSHKIYASYSGDQNFSKGTSPTITQTVTNGSGPCIR